MALSEHIKSHWLLALSLAIVLTVGLLYAFFSPFRDFLSTLVEVLASGDEVRARAWVAQYGAWGPLVVILAMVLQMFVIVLPSWLIMVVAVLAYGPVWGTLLAITAVAVASTVGYAVGLTAGEHSIDRLLGKTVRRKATAAAERYGFWAVVVTRLNPLISNDAISIIAGLIRLGYLKFLAATLVGITPLAVLIAILGRQSSTIDTALLILSVLSLAGLGGKIWWDRRQEKLT